MNDYAILIEKISINRKSFDTLKEAVDYAVDECIKNGVLREFLQKHRGEVTDLVLSQYDEEAYIKSEKEISFEDGYEDGYEKCRNELQPVIEDQNGQIEQLNSQLQTQYAKLNEQNTQLQKQNETISLLSEYKVILKYVQ